MTNELHHYHPNHISRVHDHNSKLCIIGECSVFKNIYIMDENDTLSEYNKIPLGHNRTNGEVYSKINFKVEIALHFRYSIVIPRANTAQT